MAGRALTRSSYIHHAPAHDSVCVPTSTVSMLSVLRATCRYSVYRPICRAGLRVICLWREKVNSIAVLDRGRRHEGSHFRLYSKLLVSHGTHVESADGSMRRQVMRTHGSGNLSSRAFRARFFARSMRRPVMRFHARSKCCRCKFGKCMAFNGHLYSIFMAFDWTRVSGPSIAMGA